MKKNRKYNPYKLFKGEIEEGYPDYEVKKYRGRTRQIQELVLPDIESAHQVARIAGLQSYAIADEHDTWGRSPVFRTDDMIRWDAEQKVASEKADIEKHAKIERLSKTPRGHILARYGRVIVYAKRGKPSDDRMGVRVRPVVYIAKPGRKVVDIDFSDYFEHGKYNKKKFLDKYSYYFGGRPSERALPRRYSSSQHRYIGRPAIAGVYPEPLQTIANDLPDIYQKYRNFVQTTWSNPIRGTRVSNPKSKSMTGLGVLALGALGLWYLNKNK